MPPALKLARELEPGDRVQIKAHHSSPEFCTVIAIVPSVQVVKRNVVLVTFRDAKGRDVQATFYEGSTMKMQS